MSANKEPLRQYSILLIGGPLDSKSLTTNGFTNPIYIGRYKYTYNEDINEIDNVDVIGYQYNGDESEKEKTGESDTEEGIARSYNGSSNEWKEAMLECVIAAATSKRYFSVDDVWKEYWKLDNPPYHSSLYALGGVMLRASGLDIMTDTGDFHLSINLGKHKTPTRIWKSLIFNKYNNKEDISFKEILNRCREKKRKKKTKIKKDKIVESNGARRGYKKGIFTKTLKEFERSQFNKIKIKFKESKSSLASTQANSINKAIRSLGLSKIKAVSKKNELFLIKEN